MTPAESFGAIPLAALCCLSNVDRQEAPILSEPLIHRTPSRTMTRVAGSERSLPPGRAAQIREVFAMLRRNALTAESDARVRAAR